MSGGLTRRSLLRTALGGIGANLELAGAGAGGSTESLPAIANAEEQVTLAVAMLDTHWTVLEPLAKAFSESTGIQLDVTELDYAALYRQISLALTQRASTFDVVCLVDSWVPQFATFLSDAHVTEALSDVLAPIALELSRFPVDARPRALPWLGEVQFFVSRPEWLGRIGQTMPETWDQTVDVASNLATALGEERELAPFGIRMRSEHERVESFLPILRGYGKSLIDAETSVPQLDTPEAQAAMQTFLTLAAVSPTESKAAGAPSNVERFDEGSIAMMADYWASDLLVAHDTESVVDSGPIASVLQPAQQGSDRQAMTGIWFAGVPVGSIQADAAFLFLDWLVSFELQMELPGPGLPPVRLDVLGNKELQAKYPELAGVGAMLAQATPRGRSPFYPQLEQLLGTELSNALDGSATGPDALKNANLALRQFLVREGVLEV